MQELTGSNVIVAVLVIFAVAQIFNALIAAAFNIKKMRKPSADVAAKVDEHDNQLKLDDRRINALDDGQKALCQAMLAMLDHELTGNGQDKLKDAKQKLTDYLIQR